MGEDGWLEHRYYPAISAKTYPLNKCLYEMVQHLSTNPGSEAPESLLRKSAGWRQLTADEQRAMEQAIEEGDVLRLLDWGGHPLLLSALRVFSS